MHRRFRLGLAAILSSAALTACGSDTSESSADNSTATHSSVTVSATEIYPTTEHPRICGTPLVEIEPTWERHRRQERYYGPGTFWALADLTLRFRNRSSDKIWIRYVVYRYEYTDFYGNRIAERTNSGLIPVRGRGEREFDSVQPDDWIAFRETTWRTAVTNGPPPSIYVVMEYGTDWWFDSPQRRRDCSNLAPTMVVHEPTTTYSEPSATTAAPDKPPHKTLEVPGVGPVEVEIPTS